MQTDSRPRSLYSGLASGENIRILTLYPGIWTDHIHCALQSTPLQDAGRYNALSYTWNNDDNDLPSPTITCNGLSVSISHNLFLGLRQLRDKTSPVRLTSQVGMMRKIYEQSTEVIVWLGESGPNDDLGEAILPMLSEKERLWSLYQWHGDDRDFLKLKASMSQEGTARRDRALNERHDMADIFGAFRVMHALFNGVEASDIQELRHFSRTGPILKGFDALMKQRWWSRAWIVQEVVVAQHVTIRYGQLSAPWKLFAHAALQYEKGRLETHADSSYPYLEQQSLVQFSQKILEIETTRNEWRSIEPLGLLPLLRKFRSRSALDERDKVFALLGLVRFWRVQERKFSPDYSLSPLVVAFMTTKSMLASYGTLSVLAGTLRPLERSDSNPSWVVDWSFPPKLNEDTRLENLLWYDAGGGSGLIELHKQRVLKIEGTYLDEVISMGDELVETTIARVRPLIRSWNEHLVRSAYSRPSFSDYIGGGTVSEAFWRTICGNLKRTKPGEEGSDNVKRGFQRATDDGALSFEQFRSADYSFRRTTSIIGGVWKESNESDANIASGTSFLHAVECASTGRRFFVTKRGYIGTGPHTIAVGDYAVVVSGSQVPFILRKAPGSETCNNEFVEVLSSANAAQPTYVDAGKDAKAPKAQEHCSETHSRLYYVVGDAYVHGVMNGEFSDPGSRQSIFLV
ncbi:hypothetical protein VTL71DRAFT_15786 [Oculimacula yallundae]|uniref:Heterokaryon incompatibility domain-containing protein n=1 Tax=Oculimacula yallundae TaxID=86028 RepID=A0ABR4CD64_9HELO